MYILGICLIVNAQEYETITVIFGIMFWRVHCTQRRMRKSQDAIMYTNTIYMLSICLKNVNASDSRQSLFAVPHSHWLFSFVAENYQAVIIFILVPLLHKSNTPSMLKHASFRQSSYSCMDIVYEKCTNEDWRITCMVLICVQICENICDCKYCRFHCFCRISLLFTSPVVRRFAQKGCMRPRLSGAKDLYNMPWRNKYHRRPGEMLHEV